MAASFGIRFVPVGFQELTRNLLTAPKIIAEEQGKALKNVGGIMLFQARKNLIKNESVDTGETLGSLRTTIHGRVLTLEALSDQAIFIEGGRKPGGKMPPEGVLIGWMKRHNIPLEYEFVIRRHIAMYGIKPKPFLSPVPEQTRRAVDAEFSAAFGRAMRRVFSRGPR